jgi:WASH complex subunit 7
MPTLILNFVEKLRLGKRESLNMRVSHLKNNRSAYFTDDGFAIGLSYILAILQQNDDFDSLQWFRSVNAHFAQVAKDVTRLRAQAEQTEDTYQEVLNKTNRLADERREIEMFYFSFSGSRIFFTEDNADADDDEEEGEGGGAEGGGGGGGGEAPPPPPPPPM